MVLCYYVFDKENIYKSKWIITYGFCLTAIVNQGKVYVKIIQRHSLRIEAVNVENGGIYDERDTLQDLP